jgi:hypothetical protein
MSPDSATIIGSPISPYVRKVLAVCEIKGIPYRLDPIVPFFVMSRYLLNIAKRSLLRLMLSCVGLASKHAAG